MRSTYKIIALCFITLLVTVSCKNEKPHDGFTISGTVKGLDNTYVKISEYTFFNQDKARVIDSVPVVNGTFKLEGKVDFPDMVMVNVDKYYGNFILENSAIELIIDVSGLDERNPRFEAEVKGSKSNDDYVSAQKKSGSVFDKEKYKPIKEVMEMFGEAKKTNNKELLEKAMKLQEELTPLFEDRNNEYTSVIYDYVRQNPSSPVSVQVMGVNYTEGRMSRELLKEFYGVFQGDARETGFFKNFITKIYKDNFENLGIGNTAPDFTLNTVDGKELTLSKVEGKYMLVDFWASWCVPCRASFPHLKELRKQYGKEGFTIIGVGTADKEDKWRKAIEEDQTPWIHVFDANEEGKNMYGPVAKKYGVPHLPTTFLVDANQKILLRNPTKEELDAKLKELFGY